VVQMASPQKRKGSGVFYFRRRVPQDLVDVFGKEVVFSLKTKDEALAKRRFTEESVKLDDRMERERHLRARPFDELTVTKAQAMAGLWLQDALDADAKDRMETDGDGLVDHRADVTSHEVTLQQMERINELPIRRRQAALLAFVADDVSRVEALHDLRLEHESISHVRLAEEIFAARWKVETVRQERQRGAFDRARKLASGFVEEFPELPREHAVVRRASGMRLAEGLDGTPALTDVVKAYLSEKNLPVGTQMETNKTIRRFVEMHGDVPVAAVNKAMVREWIALLQKLPKRQTARQKKMKIRELVVDCEGLSDDARLAFTSVNKDIGTLATVLKFASARWSFPNDWRNPTEGMKIERPREVRRRKRQSFNDGDLNAIFSMPIFTEDKRPKGGAGEAAKWLPLLACYTGARLEELGQLRVADIEKVSGVWCIDINENHGKRVKTESSIRQVPLHSDLTMRLGFLDYLEKRSKEGPQAMLFPELKRDVKDTLTGSWGVRRQNIWH